MKITDEQFIKAMHDVVKGNEDFEYEIPKDSMSCVYFDEKGNPSCLIGHALIECGVGVEFFTGVSNLDSATRILPEFGLSKKVVHAATEAQVAQDFGDQPWGKALEAFNAVMGDTNG